MFWDKTGEIMNELRKMWVDSEYDTIVWDGFRCLHDRQVDVYEGKGWKTIYANKTCMRDTQVVVLDEAVVRYI